MRGSISGTCALDLLVYPYVRPRNNSKFVPHLPLGGLATIKGTSDALFTNFTQVFVMCKVV